MDFLIIIVSIIALILFAGYLLLAAGIETMELIDELFGIPKLKDTKKGIQKRPTYAFKKIKE